MSKGSVLVTGATGFIGSHMALAFLEEGYRVRGTTRTTEKAKAFEKINPSSVGKIEWVIVKDGAVDGAYNEAMKGIEICIHNAAPCTFEVNDPDGIEKALLIPHIKSAQELLGAAKRAGSVTHLMLTSSFAAICDFGKGLRPGYCYSEKDWNPATCEEAKYSGHGVFAYCATKALTERYVWDNREHIIVTAVCSGAVTGPVRHPVRRFKDLNFSNVEWFLPVITKKEDDLIPPTPQIINSWTDVRDVVKFYLKAVEDPRLHNARVMCVARHVTNVEMVKVLREIFADRPEYLARIPSKGGQEQMPEYFTIDNSFSRQFVDYRTIEEAVGDTVLSIWEIEKNDGNY